MQLVPAIFRTSPIIPEYDYAGVILATGSAVRPALQAGVYVFGVESAQAVKTGKGTLAEYIVREEDYVVVKPDNIGLEDAAGLGVVGITALQFVEQSGLKTGDSVLVNGGSGGTGQMCIQEARRVVGPTGQVVTTCSGRNAEIVKSLGVVDEIIDYTAHNPLHGYLATTYSASRFDAIIDCVGSQELYNYSPSYLKEGKPFLNMGSGFGERITLRAILAMAWGMTCNYLWPRVLGGTARKYIFFGAKPEAVTLERLRQYVGEGKLKTMTDSVWDMEDALKVGSPRVLSS